MIILLFLRVTFPYLTSIVGSNSLCMMVGKPNCETSQFIYLWSEYHMFLLASFLNDDVGNPYWHVMTCEC